MATLTLTIPDALVPRIFAAFAKVYRYDPDSGVTQGAFIKAHLVEYVRNIVVKSELQAATLTAAQTTKTDLDSAITIT